MEHYTGGLIGTGQLVARGGSVVDATVNRRQLYGNYAANARISIERLVNDARALGLTAANGTTGGQCRVEGDRGASVTVRTDVLAQSVIASSYGVLQPVWYYATSEREQESRFRWNETGGTFPTDLNPDWLIDNDTGSKGSLRIGTWKISTVAAEVVDEKTNQSGTPILSQQNLLLNAINRSYNEYNPGQDSYSDRIEVYRPIFLPSTTQVLARKLS
jgi:hypothetical protein